LEAIDSEAIQRGEARVVVEELERTAATLQALSLGDREERAAVSLPRTATTTARCRGHRIRPRVGIAAEAEVTADVIPTGPEVPRRRRFKGCVWISASDREETETVWSD